MAQQENQRRVQAGAIAELKAQIEELLRQQRSLNRRAGSLQRRNIQLQELNRIKDEFIAVASHQLRTPATGVKQYLGLLLQGYADPLSDNQRVFLEKANEGNDRQLRIIDDLLQVAQVDSESFSMRLAPLDIGQVVAVTIDGLRKKLESRKQAIDYLAPKKKIMILGDAERLPMVFENLVDNASNYSYDEDKISVRLRTFKGYALVEIQDQGVGINRRDIPLLFQKFSRIPNALSVEVGGTGLGLYWAQKIVNMHGGEIIVTSEPDSGSTFTVKIPVAPE
ncbi:MAG TPA: HAMP domain-containing sensor histidine kinase [Candidatus Saccharimonadales bacterium]|nr:HAMP domain-containing sensor histidine kinase [Candidatus Saccharimonadales bacterium]